MSCIKMLEVAEISEGYGIVTFFPMTFYTMCWVPRGIFKRRWCRMMTMFFGHLSRMRLIHTAA